MIPRSDLRIELHELPDRLRYFCGLMTTAEPTLGTLKCLITDGVVTVRRGVDHLQLSPKPIEGGTDERLLRLQVNGRYFCNQRNNFYTLSPVEIKAMILAVMNYLEYAIKTASIIAAPGTNHPGTMNLGPGSWRARNEPIRRS